MHPDDMRASDTIVNVLLSQSLEFVVTGSDRVIVNRVQNFMENMVVINCRIICEHWGLYWKLLEFEKLVE